VQRRPAVDQRRAGEGDLQAFIPVLTCCCRAESSVLSPASSLSSCCQRFNMETDAAPPVRSLPALDLALDDVIASNRSRDGGGRGRGRGRSSPGRGGRGRSAWPHSHFFAPPFSGAVRGHGRPPQQPWPARGPPAEFSRSNRPWPAPERPAGSILSRLGPPLPTEQARNDEREGWRRHERSIQRPDGSVALRLYETDVIVVRPAGDITLNSAGFLTSARPLVLPSNLRLDLLYSPQTATQKCLFHALALFGLTLACKAVDEWTVSDGKAFLRRWTDGMVLPSYAGAQPGAARAAKLLAAYRQERDGPPDAMDEGGGRGGRRQQRYRPY